MPKPSENIPFPLYLLELLLRQNHINSFWLNIRPSASSESSCSQRENPGGYNARLWSILRCGDDFSHPDICDLASWRKKKKRVNLMERQNMPTEQKPRHHMAFSSCEGFNIQHILTYHFHVLRFYSQNNSLSFFSPVAFFPPQLTLASFFKDKHFSSVL